MSTDPTFWPSELSETGAHLRDLPLVDHHCHGVVEHDLRREAFEDLITESDRPAPDGTTFFDTQLGFAIRAHCAPVLDLPAFASPEDYLARRRELGAREVNRRLLTGAGIGDYVVETGHRGDEILTPERMGERAGSGFAEVVRLEVAMEELVAQGVGADDAAAAFRGRLDEALHSAVGVKTIAAYRGGFRLSPTRPTEDDVHAAIREWRPEADGSWRLTDERLVRFGWWEAIERGVPIQFHVGYGDPDVDLLGSNPLLLTDLCKAARGSGASFLLLHCYPYHREAGYLAHVFEHVYADVGLAVTYTGARSSAVIAESLELTPFHKALFSSDAFGAAELFYLGAGLLRRGLADALDAWGDRDGWPASERRRVADLVGRENARRVYRLDAVPGTSFGPPA